MASKSTSLGVIFAAGHEAHGEEAGSEPGSLKRRLGEAAKDSPSVAGDGAGVRENRGKDLLRCEFG